VRDGRASGLILSRAGCVLTTRTALKWFLSWYHTSSFDPSNSGFLIRRRSQRIWVVVILSHEAATTAAPSFRLPVVQMDCARVMDESTASANEAVIRLLIVTGNLIASSLPAFALHCKKDLPLYFTARLKIAYLCLTV
jgi:hypothetical protein